MLVKPKTEDLLKKVDNRYELVIAISKRGRQIINGSEPTVDYDENEKSELTIAALELNKNKFDIETYEENVEE